jgi:hypothetical protein
MRELYDYITAALLHLHIQEATEAPLSEYQKGRRAALEIILHMIKR